MKQLALTVMALTVIGLPVYAADLDGSTLLGCWRDVDERIPEGAKLVTSPNGDTSLSWGTDPNTGLEITGMVPYNELCFGSDRIVESVHIGYDEGLGSSGPYSFDGQILSVHDTFDFPDGWLFGSRDAQCQVRIDDDVLTLGACDAEARYVRTVTQ